MSKHNELGFNAHSYPPNPTSKHIHASTNSHTRARQKEKRKEKKKEKKRERKREKNEEKNERQQVFILPVSEIPHSQDFFDFFLTPCCITGKPISTI